MKKAYVIVNGVRYQVHTENLFTRFKRWLDRRVCLRGFWGRVWDR